MFHGGVDIDFFIHAIDAIAFGIDVWSHIILALIEEFSCHTIEITSNPRRTVISFQYFIYLSHGIYNSCNLLFGYLLLKSHHKTQREQLSFKGYKN